jgi:polysaccharide export outer membrane protein
MIWGLIMSRKKFIRASMLALFSLTIIGLIFVPHSWADETEPPPYRIGPSDVLNIFVWKEAELTQDVTVLPDGRITFPLIGEVLAQGQTISDLRKTFVEKLEKFITAPEVTVVVKATNSQVIYTIGKVNAQGPRALLANMTVLQAISASGGFNEWADTKNISIIRREKEKEIRYRFNYNEFIAGKNLDQNIVLKPNDTIVVP